MKPGSLHLSDSSGPAPSPSVGQGNLLKREVFLRIISSIGRAGSFAQVASLVTYLRVCLSIILPSLARRERRLSGRPGFCRRLPTVGWWWSADSCPYMTMKVLEKSTENSGCSIRRQLRFHTKRTKSKTLTIDLYRRIEDWIWRKPSADGISILTDKLHPIP